MLRKTWTGLLTGAAIALAAGLAAAQELTIFWAEWDPANYLQELVNDYTAETGVTVTVQTTPWPDFQTKAFTEFNAHGDSYDMVVGDSQWLGAGSTGGHYVDLTDFFAQHKRRRADGSGDGRATTRNIRRAASSTGPIPLEGDAAGWAYRKDWFEDPKEMEAFKAKYGYDLGVPKDLRAAARHRRVLLSSRREETTASPSTPTIPMTRLIMGIEGAVFSYGGELGDYSTYKVDGILNSPQNVAAPRDVSRPLQVHAAELGQDVLHGGQPGDHREPGGHEPELLRLLPGARQRGHQPERQGHRLLRQPGGPGWQSSIAALGGQGISIVSYSKNQEEAFKFLEVVREGRDPEEVGRAWRLYLLCRGAASRMNSSKATPFNEAFYQTMFMVKDFWAMPEYAELLTAINNRAYPFIVGGEGTAQEVLDATAADWNATFKKYGYVK